MPFDNFIDPEGYSQRLTPEQSAQNMFKALEARGYNVVFKPQQRPLLGYVRPTDSSLEVFTGPLEDDHTVARFEEPDKSLFVLRYDEKANKPSVGANAFWIPLLPEIEGFPTGTVEKARLNFLMLDSKQNKYQLLFDRIYEDSEGIHYPWMKKQGSMFSPHIKFTFQPHPDNPNLLIPHKWIPGN